MSVEQAMAPGRERYSDALVELGRYGPAQFTQTGGMCAALELTLERGVLLVTDAEDSLPWDRSELQGWGVGFYPTTDASDGPEAFASSDDTSLAALAGAVEACLREVVARR